MTAAGPAAGAAGSTTSVVGASHPPAPPRRSARGSARMHRIYLLWSNPL